MTDAEWAIPGLMPPVPVNDLTTINANADGSLKLLLWCGRPTDTVAVNMTSGFMWRITHDMEDEYVTSSTDLDPEAIVPWRKIHGHAVNVGDRCDLDRENVVKTYWVLTLPEHALHFGDTIVEVLVNGHPIEYIVHRPVTLEHLRPRE